MKKIIAKVLVFCFLMTLVQNLDINYQNENVLKTKNVAVLHAAELAQEEVDGKVTDFSFKHKFRIQSEWENHFNAEIELENITEYCFENWEVAFRFDGEIENIWNAKIMSHEGNEYVIKNVGWNQDIKSGTSVSFGITVKYSDKKPQEPYDYDMERVEEDIVDGYTINYNQFTKYEGNKIQGQVEITNTSKCTIEDWGVEFESNFKIIQMWNAHETDYTYLFSDGESKIIGVQHDIRNVEYNQNIEPGQTINFGFIAELTDEKDSNIQNHVLYQLVVHSEEDEVSDDDCIWEGDELDETMSVIEDEEFDEDDYAHMEEDEIWDTEEDGSVLLRGASNEKGIVESQKTNLGNFLSRGTTTGKKDGDEISYRVVGLAHQRQVQSWCMYEDILFVAQNDKAGNTAISLCKRNNNGDYQYQSEIQIHKSGHAQSLYCYKKKRNKYYLLTNTHGVKLKNQGKEEIWGTRFGRVIFNTEANGVNGNGKKAKQVMDNDKTVTEDSAKSRINLECTYKEEKLKYFKAVAYSRKKKSSFAGESIRKGVAKLKRCDFSISPNGKYMAIWKKSDSNKIEYSLYTWGKVEKIFRNAEKYATFNSDEARKWCKTATMEKNSNMHQRSFQGIAVDKSGNIVITSGDDRKHNENIATNLEDKRYIALFYKKYKNSTFGETKEVKLEIPNYKMDTWMRDAIKAYERSKENKELLSPVPYQEIEGAQIYGDKVYFAVGIVSNKAPYSSQSWRDRSYIFSRKLSELYK